MFYLSLTSLLRFLINCIYYFNRNYQPLVPSGQPLPHINDNDYCPLHNILLVAREVFFPSHSRFRRKFPDISRFKQIIISHVNYQIQAFKTKNLYDKRPSNRDLSFSNRDANFIAFYLI